MSSTDWNDLHVAHGLDAVREQLLPLLSASAAPAEPAPQHAQADVGGELPPIEAYAGEVTSNWRDELLRTDTGGVIGNHANAYLILANDERWHGVLAYNEFSQRIVKRRPPPYEGGKVGDWEDSDISKTLVWLQREWRLPLKQPKSADEAARMVAADNHFHEVREWLNGLPKWDGTDRLWDFMTQAFGAACDTYTSHIGTGWLVSAVARILVPGCKVDTMLVLEGGQGLGKSTAILELFGAPWYLETSEPPSTKDFYVLLQGSWVVEIGEMQSFTKSEVTLVKQAISRRDDKFRAPYDRYGSAHPRQCIFVGTTNADTYLSDPTGARRFLPVMCRAVDLDFIRKNRDQLWAQALVQFREGFKWWDFPVDKANAEQEARFVSDSWEEPIGKWLEGRATMTDYPKDVGVGRIDKVTTTQLLQYALRVEMGKHTRQDQLRVAAIMRRMGWKQGPLERVGTVRWRYYLRPPEEGAQPPPAAQQAA
jgi:predicted P-loop ATPase